MLISIFVSFIPSFLTISNFVSILLGITLLIVINRKKDKTRNQIEAEPSLPIEEVKEEPVFVKDIIQEVVVDPRGSNRPKTCHSCTEEIYFIRNSLPVIKKLTLNTQKVEEVAISELYQRFESISEETDEIVKSSEDSLESIFDTDKSDNLAYVLNASKEINREFSRFMEVISNMNLLADEFIKTSMDSFNYISKTTKDIIELAEQVKVISINVRIEAARIKDSGGFKVLGNDISNFADKTAKVAESTNQQIKDTVNNIEKQRVELSSQIKYVDSAAKNIFNRFNPFENILDYSATSIKGIIKNFNDVSVNLQNNLQSSIQNMQFQDIASQETNHILQFLEKIADSSLMDRNYDLYMDDNQKKVVRGRVINFLKEISTTASEEEEVVRFSKEWNLDIAKEEESKNTKLDNGVFLF